MEAMTPEGQSERLTVQQIIDLVTALIVGAAPEALDQLAEFAEAIGGDANFAQTVLAALDARMKLDGSTPMTGNLNLNGRDLQNAANFVGLTGLFYGNAAPAGWLKLNGASLSRASYPALWTYAQGSGALVTEAAWATDTSKFSSGNGSTTFRIPDARGEFFRAFDDGRGIDAGRAIGSAQAHALMGHQHYSVLAGNIPDQGINGILKHVFGASGLLASATGQAYEYVVNDMNVAEGPEGHFLTSGVANAANTATETRPRNVALLACIKF